MELTSVVLWGFIEGSLQFVPGKLVSVDDVDDGH